MEKESKKSNSYYVSCLLSVAGAGYFLSEDNSVLSMILLVVGLVFLSIGLVKSQESFKDDIE
ncbi:MULTISPECIES: hypothetical protein [Pseudoalteromonas]|uniref:hypothetical protein n=1 Tax=Pseudoalteromonas TaxID=53246 RepID=UPI00026CB373|nr:hypothetical protein [Pseudoalteromonas spongiae]ATD00747.1 hypothetical protein PSPO_b0787 [Pseudoalteromonas spongiae UST010723-006]